MRVGEKGGKGKRTTNEGRREGWGEEEMARGYCHPKQWYIDAYHVDQIQPS